MRLFNCLMLESRPAPRRFGAARLSPEEIEIARLAIIPEKPDTLPLSVEALPTLAIGGGRGDVAPFLKLVAIREIIIGREKQDSLSQSHLLLTRERDTLRVTTSLAYRQGGIDSSVDAVGYFKPGEGGHADIALDNINPRDIGRFSKLLAPLQGVQLPLTAQIAVDFDADGQPSKASPIYLSIRASVLLTAGSLQIDELTLAMDTDFASRRITFNDVRFNIQGVAGRVTGHADYTQGRKGLIERLDFILAGQGAQVNLPQLFDRQLQVARLDTSFGYDIGRSQLEIDRLTVAHNFGQAELTGAISFVRRADLVRFDRRFWRDEPRGRRDPLAPADCAAHPRLGEAQFNRRQTDRRHIYAASQP